MLALATAAVVARLAAAPAKTAPVTVMHVIADDLGYHDVGFRNGQSLSPTIDRLAREGVEIKEFYVYKMCAPSRASALSGRYPWHVGYYANNGGDDEGVPLDFWMTPKVLKTSGQWESHAYGKWHVGWLYMNYTATYRGFDSFYGSSGNTDNYWYHYTGHSGINAYDFIDVKAQPNPNPTLHVALAENGTYDSRSLWRRAALNIRGRDPAKSAYHYLAFHNVHVPLHAPLETVSRFPHITTDARKVADAMLLELDYALGNLSNVLEGEGLLNRTVWFIHTDNGGPGSHACNYPLRGGKFSFWEGGVRGFAIASSPLFPAAVHNTAFNGMAHLADLYATIIVGIAGIALPDNTGPIAPDSHNLWDALTSGTASPRNEVVHLPLNTSYANTFDCMRKSPGHGCAPSIRIGRYKLLMAWPGDDMLWSLPPPSSRTIPYGRSGGVVEPGTDHAIGPHWKNGGTPQNSTCTVEAPCLYDVVADPSETDNLGGQAQYSAIIANLTARLQEVSKTGSPYNYIIPQALDNFFLDAQTTVMNHTGAWLPLGYNGTEIPNPPPVPPAPLGPCTAQNIATICPHRSSSTACRTCCRQHSVELHAKFECKPKDYQAYCNSTFTQL